VIRHLYIGFIKSIPFPEFWVTSKDHLCLCLRNAKLYHTKNCVIIVANA
jgi:hypothetical protein